MTTHFRNDSQFAATKLWLAILEKFYMDMPLTRHRRQLRVFNDTFTGKDAADFLFSFLPSIYTNRECTRKTAVSLLQFFLNYKYLVNVRNEDDFEFHDNVALYSFCNEKVERFIKDRDSSFCARRVRRVSSLKTSSLSSYNKNNDCSVFSQNRHSTRLEMSEKQSFNNFLLPDQAPSGRLSMSCNDLTRITQESAKPSTSYFVQNTKKNLKILCDSVLKSSENVKNSSLGSIRNMSPLIHRISSRSGKPPKIMPSPFPAITSTAENPTPIVNQTPKKCLAITDADEFKLWKICLIERFKQAAGLSSERTILNHDFSGADIRWNCKMVSERGVVSKLPENLDDFSLTLVDNLKALANWSSKRTSTDSGKSINVNIVSSCSFLNGRSVSSQQVTYKNVKLLPEESTKRGATTTASPTEHDIFRQLVRALVPFAPLIPADISQSLVATFDLISNKYFDPKNLRSTAKQQLQQQRLSSSIMSPRMATRINVPNVTALSPLNTLPPPPPITTLQRRMSLNDELTSSFTLEGRDKFNSCIRLCLLTLRPSVRRKLQILLRYLRRIARNTELQLKEGKCFTENRIYILDRLSALFIEPSNTVSDVKSANFLAFLIDHVQDLLFEVPHWLETDVQQKVDNLISGKEYLTLSGGLALSRRSHESVYGRRRLRPSSTPPKLSQTFCDRIDSSTYEMQRHQIDADLLKLLDTTIANENLKPTKKAEFLKTFRATYPRIYSKRFPDDFDCNESSAATSIPTANSKSIITRMRQLIV